MHCALVDSEMDSAESWIERCLSESDSRSRYTSPHSPLGSFSNEEEQDEKENSRASKPHSTPATLQWLEENYEIAEGVCIPRSALYMHYLDFSEKNDTHPVNAASFGKIIRQQFPQLTTRRLGTRGQSKYHYYGIAVKECSLYYDIMYSKKGAAGVPEGGKKETPKPAVAYSPRSKLGTLLPEFPSVLDLHLPSNVPEEKVSTFIMMYRTHCQRILDTVIRANFDEVQSFLLHFWQGMPAHMLPVLGSPTVVNIVGVCDSILYKAISGVLMPTVLQALPDSLTQVIRKFAKQLDEWLMVALEDLPVNLRNVKFELARRFSQILRRQTSLNHLCQASRTVIHSADITSQMLEDWHSVDLMSISKQTLYTLCDWGKEHRVLIEALYQEFEQLLEDQAPMESYIEWLDSMVDRCVVKPASCKRGCLRRAARQFLLMWSCFGTRIIRDMTLHSAPSFGSFHLIHLMFDDYVLYLLESLHFQERAADLLRAMKGEEPIDFVDSPLMNKTRLSTPLPFVTSDSAALDRQSVTSSLSGHSPEPLCVTSPTGSSRSFPCSPTSFPAVAAPHLSLTEPLQAAPCPRTFATHSPVASTRVPAYGLPEEHGYSGNYSYSGYGGGTHHGPQHPSTNHPYHHPLASDSANAGPLHYPSSTPLHYHRTQYPFNGQANIMDGGSTGSTVGPAARFHITPAAPRWAESTIPGGCFAATTGVPPAPAAPQGIFHPNHHHHHHHHPHNHSAGRADIYPLHMGATRPAIDYDGQQSFPGFAYIASEAAAASGWTK
uniref:Regulatory factor X, 4 n=1 Tax=Eptatretus burgeri TaxID=7764 RepID=A0A8C4WZM2_EPTBU